MAGTPALGSIAVVVCLVSAGAAETVHPSSSTAEDSILRRVDEAENRRSANLLSYTVHEHYSVLRNGVKTPVAEMDVDTTYAKGQGKTFTVRSRSGSRFFQQRVLDRLLHEEEQLSRPGTREHVLMNSTNYSMKAAGEETVGGRRCFVLQMTPRSRKSYLLNSRIWVDAKDYGLVRIEGKPSAAPSFFIGNPTIIREYGRVEGFALANRSHATTSTFLLGTTEIIIDYTNYQVKTGGPAEGLPINAAPASERLGRTR